MRLSLSSKISVAIVGVLALAMLSSVVAIRSAHRFEAFQRTLVSETLESVRAAEELEIALLEQRGYVSSYILDDGHGTWLQQLNRHHEDFDDWLDRARATASTEDEREILDRLEHVQQAYAEKREHAIALFDSGQVEQAKTVLLHDVTALYQEAYTLCEEFIATNQSLASAATNDVRNQVERITLVVTTVLCVTLGLSVALLWFFFHDLILPLRRIATDLRSAAGDERNGAGESRPDELRELGHYVRLLMSDVAETRSDLQHSRLKLAQSDKLVTVGKLAASVAHEIRNPLTSVKMWLYSLRRIVGEDEEVQKKFDIVSDEIARLESIVRHFLEFSRPPKLNLQPQLIGPVIDSVVDFMRDGVENQNITIERDDEADLPNVMADSEQIKQVVLNLINNAVEAMPTGGHIRIGCSLSHHVGRKMVVVRVADSGSGIPPEVQKRLFEPFFTTKEEGTGLGLCVAASVMAGHNGLLEVESTSGRGTVWTAWLPIAT